MTMIQGKPASPYQRDRGEILSRLEEPYYAARPYLRAMTSSTLCRIVTVPTAPVP